MGTDVRQQPLSREEIEASINLTYLPIMLALSRRVKRNADNTKTQFVQIDVDKDSIAAAPMSQEMTERKHIKAGSRKRSFNAYLKGAKFTQSNLNGRANDLTALHNEVIWQYGVFQDEDFLWGDGENNGLLRSKDDYYVKAASHQITGTSTFERISDLKKVVASLKRMVNKYTTAKNLVVFYYGDKLVELLDEETEQGKEAFAMVQSAMRGKLVKWVEIPQMLLEDLKVAGDGIVVCSEDLTEVEYADVPRLMSDGTNVENNYYYANYVLGSVQVTPLKKGAIINQPLTFA